MLARSGEGWRAALKCDVGFHKDRTGWTRALALCGDGGHTAAIGDKYQEVSSAICPEQDDCNSRAVSSADLGGEGAEHVPKKRVARSRCLVGSFHGQVVVSYTISQPCPARAHFSGDKF